MPLRTGIVGLANLAALSIKAVRSQFRVERRKLEARTTLRETF